MTKAVFEEARRNAVAAYMDKAMADHERPEATRSEKNNATRRFNLCADTLTEWNFNGFWTPQNVAAYNMIYKSQPDTSAVSAF